VSHAVGEIDSNTVAETMASITARAARKSQAHEALKVRLQLIAHTARVIDETDAELHGHFVVPDKKSDPVLLTAARQFVQRATPLAAQFIEHGMPQGFLGELATLIQTFEGALRDRGTGRVQRVAARTNIREAFGAAFKAVRQLDVIVANHLTANPAACEVWNRSRRVRSPYKKGSRPLEIEAMGESPPAPAAVAPVSETDEEQHA
jgi:hypothetical protein